MCTGYRGTSCETCAPGFTRVQQGRYLGRCVSCTCNGHANQCDSLTGACEVSELEQLVTTRNTIEFRGRNVKGTSLICEVMSGV